MLLLPVTPLTMPSISFPLWPVVIVSLQMTACCLLTEVRWGARKTRGPSRLAGWNAGQGCPKPSNRSTTRTPCPSPRPRPPTLLPLHQPCTLALVRCKGAGGCCGDWRWGVEAEWPCADAAADACAARGDAFFTPSSTSGYSVLSCTFMYCPVVLTENLVLTCTVLYLPVPVQEIWY